MKNRAKEFTALAFCSLGTALTPTPQLQRQRLRAPQLERAVLTASGNFAAIGRPVHSKHLHRGQQPKTKSQRENRLYFISVTRQIHS
jgi:hypothetical protein